MEFTILQALQLTILGAVLGAVGQCFRVVVGLKKAADEAKAEGKELSDVFNGNTLLVSFLISAAAGALAAISINLPSGQDHISNQFLLSIVAAGYSGSDFIQGFMNSRMPGASTTGSKVPTT